MNLIIVAGMPAAGKSTIARKIGEAFGYLILEKDDIKEELFEIIGYKDLAEKRKLDAASTAALLRCTRAVLQSENSMILVNNFPAHMADTVQKMIEECGCRTVTVFLQGDHEVFYQRYVERDRKHARHIGHSFINRYPPHPEDNLKVSMTRNDFYEIFEKNGMAEFRIKGPRIHVDATYPEKVDVESLIQQIRQALDRE